MGGASSFTITSFPFFLLTTTLILIHLCNTVIAGSNGESNPNGIHVTRGDNHGSPPTAAAAPGGKKSDAALKPSAAVVVGVLTTTFSLSFLLLLYIKHCSRGATLVPRGDRDPQGGAAPSEQRKHSGICREVVESLPMFQFGSLRGRKNGLDCAVCLAGFEELEVLRLLPKCKHAFHMDCVDTWLSAHSTCPLCRYKVHGDDVALAREEEASDIERGRRNNNPENENLRASGREEASDIERGTNNDGGALPGHENRRASGREEGSDTERGRNNVGSALLENKHRRATGSNMSSEFLDIVLHTPKNDTETSSFRGSSEEVVASPGKNEGSLGGRMSGERRLDHRIILSPTNSRGGDYEERSNGDEPVNVLYLRPEMILSDGRRTASVSEHGHDVGNDETGVLRCMSEMTGVSRNLRGKNRGRKGGNVGAGSR